MGFWGLLSYLKKYKLQVGLNIGCNILMAIFIVVNVPLFIPLLDILFQKDVEVLEPKDSLSFGNAIEHIKYFFSQQLEGYDPNDAILWVCFALVLLFFLKNLFRYMAMFFISPVRTGIVRDLRNELYSKITSLPLSFYSEEKKGDILARVSSDVQEIESSILNVLETIFREPIVIIGSLCFMLMISVKLTFFVFVLLIFTGIVIGGISRSLKKNSFDAQQKLGGLISRLEETLGGMRIIKAFNAEDYLNKSFAQENEAYRNVLTRIYWRRDLSSPLSEFLGILVVAVLMWFGSKLVFTEQIAAATFFAFLYAFFNVINPAKAFSSAFYNVQKGLAALQRISFIFDAQDNLKEEPGQQSVSTVNNALVFEKVDFSYPSNDRQVLSAVDFEIKKGSTVALVGSSGSGKTTIVDLLARFYDVSKGRILLDGKNIKDLKPKELRNLMGIVSQEPVLFNDSVINNIRFGKKGISKNDVIRAATVANAHEFIMNLEDGYETYIGDRGVKLSGGQRQRLTIARAILDNPPILILDEATSSLDSESEKLVQESMERIMKGRTAIIVAHRLSTIKKADKIIVLQDGRIIEQGTHDDLLKIKGEYQKLVELQAF